ncbi:MAG TPA: bifunctional pyr operon transcriptional regulator/uracil phosphoribosyltransferase PyrR [Verrucomicrobiae bacterium]|nr:bifunctional pyr operon transcriptional regulator/uracil phosphoribosyltransferase PyrR [Verrucomicrobiae bacterium]
MKGASRAAVMDAAAMDRVLARLAHEILEHHPDLGALALVGIRTRGVPLAERLRAVIAAQDGRKVPLGSLDITLYRDDVGAIGAQALLRETRIPFPIDGRRIVLVDDVLYTGRTIRAALDGLIDFGRPKSIELAVLIDRGHRELPIHADYVGKAIPTREEDEVKVRLRECDGEDSVRIEAREVKGESKAAGPRGLARPRRAVRSPSRRRL